MPSTKIGRGGSRILRARRLAQALQQGRGERRGDAGHPAACGSRIIGDAGPFQSVALIQMGEGAVGVTGIEKCLAEREMQQHAVTLRLRAVRAKQSLHRRDGRIIRREGFEVRAIEPGRGRTRKNLDRARKSGLGLRGLTMFHEQNGAVDQRLFRGRARQGRRAIIGRKRGVELSHRLQHEAMGVMRFRMLWIRRDRAARGIQRRLQLARAVSAPKRALQARWRAAAQRRAAHRGSATPPRGAAAPSRRRRD